jgi:hypothetical protein
MQPLIKASGVGENENLACILTAMVFRKMKMERRVDVGVGELLFAKA